MTSPRHTKQFQIGTRGSALALCQAQTVQALLHKHFAGHDFPLEIIRPEGDMDKHSSLTVIGGRGVFTSALQVQLLEGRVDLAVHSTKDLPSLSPDGVTIAAFPLREDARDAIVSRHRVSLEELPREPVIGTSSRRRAAQILAIRPDAVIRDLRGNIDTRLEKSRSNAYDAVILAAAGLRRMGWGDQITALMPIDRFVPAPGQGALSVETRVAPDQTWEMVSRLDDAGVRLAVATERAFLRGVGGGCTTPIGAHAVIERVDGEVTVRFWGMLASDDNLRLERVYEEFSPATAESEGFAVANRVMRSIAPKWTGVGQANPLAGISVLVTGSDAQAQPLIRELSTRGADPVRMPTFSIEPVEDLAVIRNAVDQAVRGTVDWLVLTSANAVGPLVDALEGREIGARIAVIGERTGAALAKAGLDARLIAEGSGAEQLLEELNQQGISQARVMCMLSNRARPVLVEGLRKAGAEVEVVTAYRNTDHVALDEGTRSLIQSGRIDAVTFASPSAVEGFRRLAGTDLPALSGAAFFAIGPTTAAALREAGLPVHAEAGAAAALGLVQAIVDYFGGGPLNVPEGRPE